MLERGSRGRPPVPSLSPRHGSLLTRGLHGVAPSMQRGAHRHRGVKATVADCEGLRLAPEGRGPGHRLLDSPRVPGSGWWGVGPAHRSTALCPSARA